MTPFLPVSFYFLLPLLWSSWWVRASITHYHQLNGLSNRKTFFLSRVYDWNNSKIKFSVGAFSLLLESIFILPNRVEGRERKPAFSSLFSWGHRSHPWELHFNGFTSVPVRQWLGLHWNTQLKITKEGNTLPFDNEGSACCQSRQQHNYIPRTHHRLFGIVIKMTVSYNCIIT